MHFVTHNPADTTAHSDGASNFSLPEHNPGIRLLSIDVQGAPRCGVVVTDFNDILTFYSCDICNAHISITAAARCKLETQTQCSCRREAE